MLSKSLFTGTGQDIIEPPMDLPTTTALYLCQLCNALLSNDNDLKLHKCQDTQMDFKILTLKQPRTNDKKPKKRYYKKKPSTRKPIVMTDGYRVLRKSGKDDKNKKSKDDLSTRALNDGGQHTCHVCNKTLSRRSGLMIHMRRHTGEMPYQCSYCKKKFVVLYDLDRHTLTHQGKKKKYSYRCNLCQKPFVTESGLTQHKSIQHRYCPEHSCETCGKRFTEKTKLALHQVSHETDVSLEVVETSSINVQLLVLYDNLT